MSDIKSRFRDNFSVTSILIVTTIFSVTKNSSRAEFDNRLFSFQQPLRFAALSTSRCGSSEILLLLPHFAAMQNFILNRNAVQ